MPNGLTLEIANGKLSKRKSSDRRYERTRKNTPLSRLGVAVVDLVTAPKISPILREIQGGKQLALKAMRFSETECIQKFLEKYDSISARDREKLSIEAIALAAKLDIRHLWGEIMLAMREHSVNAVKVIAVGSHPAMIKKQVEFAMTPGGSRDREALNIMLGASPSPKGPTFINKFFAGGRDQDDSKEDPAEELVGDVEYIFPDSSQMQERNRKALPGK